MTSGPFLVEKVVKQDPRYDPWVARYISKERRIQLVSAAAIVGIFVASFLAFNDERTIAVRSQEQAAQANGYRSFPHKPLSSGELADLYRSIGALARVKLLVAAATGDISSARLARQVNDCLRPLGIIQSPIVTPGWVDDEDDYGISLQVKDPGKPSQNELAYHAAFKAAGMAVRFTRLPDFQSGTIDLVLFVGPDRGSISP